MTFFITFVDFTGHCSSSGEYYDAYPVSPVMVAAGYPPVYYPMVPYAPLDWNGVPAPMYPIVAAPPPPHQLPAEDSSLLSPGLQVSHYNLPGIVISY